MEQIEIACRDCDRGAFDLAVVACDAIARDRLEHPVACSLAASAYRQTGQHAIARTWDLRGLEAGRDTLGAAMCRLGLVADAVGIGDRQAAERALATADDVVAFVPRDHWAVAWFDPWLTRAWVAAEVALMFDRPDQGVEVLRPYADLVPDGPTGTRWPFERAKTALFLGVCLRCAGQMIAARQSFQSAARIAVGANLAPLIGPAVGQLAMVEPELSQSWFAAASEAEEFLAKHRPPPPKPHQPGLADSLKRRASRLQ